MRNQDWVITKWCKSITDSGKDEKVMDKPKNMQFKFRLKDDDGIIYCYGYSKTNDDDKAFEPLDWAQPNYGCTTIEYYDNGVWEVL